MGDNFEVIGRIIEVETIAVNHSIRDLEYLNSKYGYGRWLKLKGVATVEFEDGTMAVAEVHWYQAHGIGKRQMKIKEMLDFESLEDYEKR